MKEVESLENFEKIWNESGWTKEARKITSNLEKFPKDSKIVLMLRHSQRNEPEIMEKDADLSLTQEGREIAKILGKKLPNERPIRLFHSRVDRCRNTAIEISNGLKEMGCKVEMVGHFEPLGNIGIKFDFFIEENKKFKILDLIFRWVSGAYPPDLWPPLIPYSQNTAKLLCNQVKSAPKRGLDIHVSHDLHLVALKFGWFGIPPNERWINYLGGFAFTITDDEILLLDKGEFKKIEIPYWWECKAF
jgi:hypothetical protein